MINKRRKRKIKSGDVFRINIPNQETYFICDYNKIDIRDMHLYYYGIIIQRNIKTGKFEIQRNVTIFEEDFLTNCDYIDENCNLDTILLAGILAHLQLGIRR